MSPQATDTSLRMTRMIRAAPERVFRAWTDPADMKNWSAPEGADVPEAVVDLRVGGRFHIRMRSPDGTEFNAVGTYREIEAPRRLVYTWAWQEEEHDVGETLVTVEFNEREGGTEVVVLHELFPNAEARDGHEEGWSSCLSRLERLF